MWFKEAAPGGGAEWCIARASFELGDAWFLAINMRPPSYVNVAGCDAATPPRDGWESKSFVERHRSHATHGMLRAGFCGGAEPMPTVESLAGAHIRKVRLY
jgi:hypothetical protein